MINVFSSDLELVSQTPPVVAAASNGNSTASTGISRAKILETVGVIVKNSSSANLLLPPSSSSPTSSSSASLTGKQNNSIAFFIAIIAFFLAIIAK